VIAATLATGSPAGAIGLSLIVTSAVLIVMTINVTVRLAVLAVGLPFCEFAQGITRRQLGDQITPFRLLIAAYVVTGLLSWALVSKRPSVSGRGAMLLGLALACVAGASAVVSSAPAGTGVTTATDAFLLPSLVFGIALLPGRRSVNWQPVAVVLLVVLIVEVAAGLFEIITQRTLFSIATASGASTVVTAYDGTVVVGVRAQGSFLVQDTYGATCALLGLATGYLFRRFGARRVGNVGLLLGAAACAISGMRGLLLPYLVVVAILLLRGTAHPVRRLVVYVGVSVAAFLAIVALANESPWIADRFRNGDDVFLRFASYLTAVRVFSANSWFGVGFGNYLQVAPHFPVTFAGYRSLPYAHSTPLAILAEGGVLSGVLYTAWWTAILRTARAWPLEAAAWATGICVFLWAGSLTVDIGEVGTVVAIAVMSLLAVGTSRQTSENPMGSPSQPRTVSGNVLSARRPSIDVGSG
jgi:hypothetical protein